MWSQVYRVQGAGNGVHVERRAWRAGRVARRWRGARLDGRALPQPADGVLDLDVDLGAVEGAAALVDRVAPPLLLERALEALRRELPDLVGADGLLGARREHHLVLDEAEFGQDALGELQHAEDLGRELLGQAEDVRVVLREAAHAEEAGERAAALVVLERSAARTTFERLPAGHAAGGRSAEGAVDRIGNRHTRQDLTRSFVDGPVTPGDVVSGTVGLWPVLGCWRMKHGTPQAAARSGGALGDETLWVR